ncbi:galactose oxidase [Streptomyces hygroscopicus subsp. limoneus]|nr:galactose oxidase [Streptomyces hygroscopicus subsp. limoneus]
MPHPSTPWRARRASQLTAAHRVIGRLSVLLTALLAVLATAITVPVAAYAAPKEPVPTSKADSPASPGQHPNHRLCGAPSRAGEMSCLAQVRDDVTRTKGVQSDATPTGFGPTDLLSAYNLPSGGAGQTVAIVDAFDNPNAESDLAVYRQQYGLPPCTTANGCFTKIDQRGGTNYPPSDANWSGEISLDLDMVSAICPSCKLLLVEADDNYMDNLGTAVNQAVAQGAKYVSNSYGGAEGSDETQNDAAYFDHPGVAVTASTGDDGYGVSYPAASPYVTAVGGTSLVKDTSTSRGWTETAWAGAGSGCSAYEPKPSFQTDPGCPRRANADVSAVADPNTGVAVYNGGWSVYGGTSTAAPIIAAVYALAGTPVAGSSPNSLPYQNASELNDITSGSNGSCDTAYLCTAGRGYDGPTGIGTPSGVAAFRSGVRGTVSGTVTDGTQPLAEAKVSAGDATTVTDGQGHYVLSVAPGGYDVTAIKFGYAAKTVSGVTVTQDQTVTEDFALTAKPSVHVTGTVRDGSGHGWPLYATVRVKGEPTAVTYTDPKTGRYTLSVPVDDSYTLQVDALYPGYRRESADVVVGSADTTHDVDATVDATTCTAGGYAYHYDGSTEKFDSTAAPTGWTVDDKNGNGQTWAFNNPSRRTNLTGGSGGFAIADSDNYGPVGTQDTSLISPVTDFSARTHPSLVFDTDYFGANGQTADIDLSVDGGQTWTNVWHHAEDSVRGPRTESVDLSQAAGKSAVQVRFHFTGRYGWWWQVDDIFLGQRTCAPTPGGLVVGQVLDKNTGTGLNGASVASADEPTVTTTSAATPDDPNLGDGFYWLYPSVTGNHTFTAAARNYVTQDATVDIAPEGATDGTLSLTAPRIEVDPASISKTVAWQGTTSQTVTLKNTGTAPVTAEIGERAGTYQPAAQGAALQKVRGDYTPDRFRPGKTGRKTAEPTAVPYAPPWTTTADYPTVVMDNGAATIGGKVYSVGGVDGQFITAKSYVYDPGTQQWATLPDMSVAREAPQAVAFGGKLYVFGGWSPTGTGAEKTAIYDPSTGTWTTGADNPQPMAGAGASVLDGKIYLVGGCSYACGSTGVEVYDPVANTWSSAHTYPQSTSWLGCGGLAHQLYCAGGVSGSSSSKHVYAYDPSLDAWSPVADLPIDLWGMGYTTAGGRLLVSGGVTDGTSTLTNQGFSYDPNTNTWSALPNSNNALYRGGAACGFYKIGGSTGGGLYPTASTEVLTGYDQCDGASDVPWLSEDKTKVTIQPGSSATVTVTLDSGIDAISQPGTYSAQLDIGAKTPYDIPSVPVTFVVSPPKTWGKITGTVTGTGCSGGSAALSGATVQVTGKNANYTLKTDKNGQYVLWLDARNSPLTLVVAKDGWAPQTRTAKITKMSTTTADFTLLPDHSCS